MPIYSYRCENCGHQQDVLQKMSDPLLVDCPECGQPTYRKQVTAAGFQLKGSGWYVTDFRNPAKKEAAKAKPDGDSGGAASSSGDAAAAPAEPAAAKPASSPAGESKSEAAPAKAAPAPPSSPSGTSGTT